MLTKDVRAYLLSRAFNAAVRAGAQVMRVYRNIDDYDISSGREMKFDDISSVSSEPEENIDLSSNDNNIFDLNIFATEETEEDVATEDVAEDVAMMTIFIFRKPDEDVL